jgi:hypothetical protein
MWMLLAAFGIVGGLAAVAATEKSDDPVLRPALQKRRLSKILIASKRRGLTRREADDGLVLARRLGEKDLAKWFEREVRKSKRR